MGMVWWRGVVSVRLTTPPCAGSPVTCSKAVGKPLTPAATSTDIDLSSACDTHDRPQRRPIELAFALGTPGLGSDAFGHGSRHRTPLLNRDCANNCWCHRRQVGRRLEIG